MPIACSQAAWFGWHPYSIPVNVENIHKWLAVFISSCTKCIADIGMGITVLHTFMASKWRLEVCPFRQKCVHFTEFHLNILYFKCYLKSWWLFCHVSVDAYFLSEHTSLWWQSYLCIQLVYLEKSWKHIKTLSNFTMVDKKKKFLFDQYLRYYLKGSTIVFSTPSAITWA